MSPSSVAKRNMWFEALLFCITISPFVFLAFNWAAKVAQSAVAIYMYLFTSTIFYFFSVWFMLLDSRKENFKELLSPVRQIRLIWAFFIACVGWVLFIHTLANYPIDFVRITGVLLSLFLFASGNFQGKLHSSSAFAGNRWFDSKFKKLQRNHARLKFWVGIVATYIFLTFQPSLLIVGYVFIVVTMLYGILFRMIAGLLK